MQRVVRTMERRLRAPPANLAGYAMVGSSRPCALLFGGVLAQNEYCKSHQNDNGNADQSPHARLRGENPV